MKKSFISLNIDFIGFGTSLACVIHCAALPVVLALVPISGLQILHNVWIEYLMLLFSFSIASISLLHGYFKYHRQALNLQLLFLAFILIGVGHFLLLEWQEMAFTSLGALIICIAHFNNWKKVKKFRNKLMESSS